MVLGEPGTEVFSAMTPPIGGFYKQMVTEQVPMPMVMSRRNTKATRFATLIEAYTTRLWEEHSSRGAAQTRTLCAVETATTTLAWMSAVPAILS